MPPHSVEAEQSLLGGLMLEPKAWARVHARVAASDLFRPNHRLIFAAIEHLHARGQDADHVCVSAFLERAGQLADAGGLDYLARILENTPSATNIEAYARIIRERATLRRLRELGDVIVRSVDERGERAVGELVADAEKGLLGLQERARTGRGPVSAHQLVSECIDDLDRRAHGERGLSIGLANFDHYSYGLEPGDLVVIAGRPGMGKTALLVSIAAHVSREKGVLVFSAEMTAQQLMRRCFALVGRIPQGKLRQAEQLGESDWDGISEAAHLLAGRRLSIDDTPGPALEYLRGEALALHARSPLGLVLVDYVQLVQGSGANRYEQLRDVAYGLKRLAKEAGFPVILLAQLNRGVETRGHDRRPRLADLRDSGAIEEAADIVGMLYSESYYNPEFGMPYVLECLIEKNRNGERGACLWHFSGEYSRVAVLDEGAVLHYRQLQARGRRGGGGDL